MLHKTNLIRFAAIAIALVALIQLWAVAPTDYLDSDDWFVVDMGRVVSEAPEWNHMTRFWSDEPTWRPILTLRTAVEYALMGANPLARVAVNLALHALCAWLLLLCVSAFFQDDKVGAIAALLFMVHPLHGETLAWYHSGFEGITVTVFILMTLWLFISERSLWMALLAFQLAIFTRENALCVPALIMLLAWSRHTGQASKWAYALKRSWPFWIVLFLNVALRLVLMQSAEHDFESLHLVDNPLIALATTIAHPWLPIHPALATRTLWLVVFAILGLGLVILQRRQNTGVLVGVLAAFLVCALPFIPHFHVAHRFIEALPGGYEQRWYFFHLPLAALMVWPAWLLVQWMRGRSKATVAVLVIVLGLFVAQFQNLSWWIERSDTATKVASEISTAGTERLPMGLIFSEGSDDANIADQVFLNHNRRHPTHKIRIYHLRTPAGGGIPELAEARQTKKGHWHWVASPKAPGSIRWWRWDDATGTLSPEAPDRTLVGSQK